MGVNQKSKVTKREVASKMFFSLLFDADPLIQPWYSDEYFVCGI